MTDNPAMNSVIDDLKKAASQNRSRKPAMKKELEPKAQTQVAVVEEIKESDPPANPENQ